MAMKNISKAEVLTLKDQVSYQKGQVVSKTLAQNPLISVTLLPLTRVKKSARMSPAATPS